MDIFLHQCLMYFPLVTSNECEHIILLNLCSGQKDKYTDEILYRNYGNRFTCQMVCISDHLFMIFAQFSCQAKWINDFSLRQVNVMCTLKLCTAAAPQICEPLSRKPVWFTCHAKRIWYAPNSHTVYVNRIFHRFRLIHFVTAVTTTESDRKYKNCAVIIGTWTEG